MRLRPPALAACAVIALLSLPTRSRADVVILSDGKRLEGDLERTGDGYNVTTADGKTTKVKASQIKSVEIKPQTTPEDARRRLESLRKSSERMTDLKLIIARYNEYLTRFAGTDAADDALADLKAWEQRQARHMTKAAGKWVTPEELGAIQEEAQASAVKARDLIAAGKLREAGPLLDLALQQDPRSPSALFLRGVAQYRQEQLGQARKNFTEALQVMPDHGPTLNNLAVVFWRQEQVPQAVKYYEQALAAAGADERVVSNVAEALNALPQEYRDAAATRKLVARFQQCEDALVKKMERRGLFRWGAAWVKGDELDKLQEIEREINAKIKDLEAEYQNTEDRITQTDDEIAETQRGMRRIEATNYGRDAQGRPVRLAMPRIYYELQRDYNALKQKRADLTAHLDDLRRQAR
jgi:Flp pilus assembly protein TadD